MQPKTLSKTGQAAQTAAPTGISLAPSSFALGGGLLDDADVTIKDAMFLLWNYDGQQQEENPALGITFLDGDGKEHDQYFSAGKAAFFVPSGDGHFLIPVGDKTSIQQSCNAAIFLASLVNIGVPEELLAAGDITALVGMQLHVNRIPAPERKGLDNPGDKKREILVATKLISLPGEAPAAAPAKTGLSKVAPKAGVAAATKANGRAAGAPAGAALAAPTSNAAWEGDEDLIMETSAAVVEVLAANDGTVARKSLSPKVFAARKGHPRAAEIMKTAFDETFLQTKGDGMFTYDGVNVSMG